MSLRKNWTVFPNTLVSEAVCIFNTDLPQKVSYFVKKILVKKVIVLSFVEICQTNYLAVSFLKSQL